jgi:SAM-dependent methyltransferase
MAELSMREFWDRRAEEDPFYFVDNRLAYRNPDLDAFWSSGEEVVDDLLSQLGASLDRSATVLDIGCGLGRTTRALSGRARMVLALDVSERMLELAREHNPDLPNVQWVLGDGCGLDGIDAVAVDACFSHVVFQHLPDPEITLRYVAEMGRVLRPGGWSAFQVSNDPTVHRRRRLSSRIGEWLRSLVGRAPRGQGHRAWLGSSVDLERLAEVADYSGMRVDRVVGRGTQMCLVLLRK